MSAKKSEPSILSATLQTSIFKSSKKKNGIPSKELNADFIGKDSYFGSSKHNLKPIIAKERHTMLDSTELTSKLYGEGMNSQANLKDDTLDLPRESISIMEPTTLFPHKENNLFPEIRRSMSSENLETLSPKHLNFSPRMARHYEKVKDYQSTVNKESNQFDKVEINDVQVNPKKIELWIGAALKESLKKGYIAQKLNDPKTSLLKVFGIDRQTLENSELEQDDINRLYRALYVYSLGFYELTKEALARSQNQKDILPSIWKVYSVLLQYVCKTEYSTVVAQLTKAYQLDVIRLDEIIEKNKADYERHRDMLELKISNLEDENMTLSNDLAEARDKIEDLIFENEKLKVNLQEEKKMRLQFEDKFSDIFKELNDYKSRLKLTSEELTKVVEDKASIEISANLQIQEATSLAADKIRLEKSVSNYQAECLQLKEEILSKSAIINQRDNRLKETLKELDNARREIDKLKRTVDEKDIRIGVIQSKIIEKNGEKEAIEANLEKMKRVNVNCEERIRELTNSLESVTEKYKQVDSKYQSIKEIKEVEDVELKTLKTNCKELQKKIELFDSKYCDYDIKYNNLNDEYNSIKKDYDECIKALEEVNKTRNILFDETHRKDETIKKQSEDIEEYEHRLYNEQMVNKRLQERLKFTETEYENLARIETTNSEMAAIQIGALEQKYLGMFKKFKVEQKLKNEWLHNYQEEYSLHLKDEVGYKDLQVQLQDHSAKRSDMLSQIREMEQSNTELKAKLEQTNDEKYDLIAKVERKNSEIDSLKLTLKNIEQHNDQYIKRLRQYGDEMRKKVVKAVDVKQMEVEDLSCRCVILYNKINNTENELRKANIIIREKDKTIKDKEEQIEGCRELIEEEKQNVINAKEELSQYMAKESERNEKYEEYLNDKLLFDIDKNALYQSIEEFEVLKNKEEERKKNAVELAGDPNDINSIGVYEKKLQTDEKIYASQNTQTINVIFSEVINKKESAGSKHSQVTYTKPLNKLGELNEIGRNSMINRSLSCNVLELKLQENKLNVPPSDNQLEPKHYEESKFNKSNNEPSDKQNNSFRAWSIDDSNMLPQPKPAILKKSNVSMRKLIKNAVVRY